MVCTDISKYGMLEGPSHKLYEKIMNKFPDIRLIASGGITTIGDVKDLNRNNIYGAIIGKAIYEGRIDLDQLIEEMSHAD